MLVAGIRRYSQTKGVDGKRQLIAEVLAGGDAMQLATGGPWLYVAQCEISGVGTASAKYWVWCWDPVAKDIVRQPTSVLLRADQVKNLDVQSLSQIDLAAIEPGCPRRCPITCGRAACGPSQTLKTLRPTTAPSSRRTRRSWSGRREKRLARPGRHGLLLPLPAALLLRRNERPPS